MWNSRIKTDLSSEVSSLLQSTLWGELVGEGGAVWEAELDPCYGTEEERGEDKIWAAYAYTHAHQTVHRTARSYSQAKVSPAEGETTF